MPFQELVQTKSTKVVYLLAVRSKVSRELRLGGEFALGDDVG